MSAPHAETTAAAAAKTKKSANAAAASHVADRVVPVKATRDILRDIGRLRDLFDRIKEGREKGIPLFRTSLASAPGGSMTSPSSGGGGAARMDEEEEYGVPVFHTFLIKELRDDGEGNDPLMVGTFVQNIFGLPFDLGDHDHDEKDAPNEAFQYMFNFNSAQEQLELRRGECYRVPLPRSVDATRGPKAPPPPPPPPPLEAESNYIPLTRYTYHVRARMRMNSEFDQFPFTVFRGIVRVELDSRNYEGARRATADGTRARFRPRLLLHAPDSRNNICLQEFKGGMGGTGVNGSYRWNRHQIKEQRKQKLRSLEQVLETHHAGEERVRMAKLRMAEEAVRNKLDEMSRFAIISPFPEITYSYDHKGHCQTFFVAFWLVEEGIPKFIRVIIPMILVAALNSINVVILIAKTTKENNQNAHADPDQENEDLDLGDFVDETVNYLNTAVTLGLTAVFLLPSISETRNNREGLTMNDLYVFLVFLGLALSSVPPALIGTNALGIVGMCLLWVSFVIPGWNLVAYRIFIRRIHADRRAASEKHKFLKDEDMKKWKPQPKKSKRPGHTPMEQFVYVKDCIGSQFAARQEEEGEGEHHDEHEGTSQWEMARKFYDVDEIGDGKFEILY